MTHPTLKDAAEAKEHRLRQKMRTVTLYGNEHIEVNNETSDGSLDADTEDNTEDSNDTYLSPYDLDPTSKQKITLKVSLLQTSQHNITRSLEADQITQIRIHTHTCDPTDLWHPT